MVQTNSMRRFYCRNKTKVDLCVEECGTCRPRSFASVKFGKKYGKERIIVEPWFHWDTELNGGILPYQVLKTTPENFYFDCQRCHHTFQVSLYECTRRSNWCPFCAGKQLCEDGECMDCYARSAASHPNIHLWSDENLRTGREDDPRMIFKHTHDKYFFDCEECRHPFEIRLDSLAKGGWCSYCNGDKLCENSRDPVSRPHPKACEWCFNHSFGSHPKAADICTLDFYNDYDTDPCQIRLGSNTKLWFTCSEPSCRGLDHHFEASVDNVVHGNTWCPFCSNPPKQLCEEGCRLCDTRSFKSCPASEYVDYDAPGDFVDASQIFKSSHKLINFKCEKGHHFTSTPNRITNNGTWCPHCKKKTEEKFMVWFEKIFPEYTVTRQAKFEWCRNPATEKLLYFDFYIPELKLLIEIDGPQHFVQVWKWEAPEEIRKRDELKEMFANRQGLTVLRLLQTDIFRDENKWDVFVKEFIAKDIKMGVVKKYASSEPEIQWYSEK